MAARRAPDRRMICFISFSFFFLFVPRVADRVDPGRVLPGRRAKMRRIVADSIRGSGACLECVDASCSDRVRACVCLCLSCLQCPSVWARQALHRRKLIFGRPQARTKTNRQGFEEQSRHALQGRSSPIGRSIASGVDLGKGRNRVRGQLRVSTGLRAHKNRK